MNVYSKYAPNVFVAKCPEMHQKGETITLTTKHGKEHECIVFNLVGRAKDGSYLYSIVRADGFNSQEYAKRKAEKLEGYAANAASKSNEAWQASHEGREFLSLGEPIKIGHHSERRHRALIERNHNRMHKSVELQRKSDDYANRAKYWESKAKTINLSMPESLEYYEFKLEEAKERHADIKSGKVERYHSFSLQYAKKEVNEISKKLNLARKLWAE